MLKISSFGWIDLENSFQPRPLNVADVISDFEINLLIVALTLQF